MDPRLRTLIESGIVDPGETAGVEELLATGSLEPIVYLSTLATGLGLAAAERFGPDAGAVDLVGAEALRRWRAVPISIDPAQVVVAVADPFDVLAADDMRFVFGREVARVVALPAAVDACLAGLPDPPDPASISFPLVEEEEPGPARLEPPAESGAALVARIAGSVDRFGEGEDDDPPPVVRLVNDLLAAADRLGASHLAISPGPEALRVRIRLAATGDWVDPEGWTFPRRIRASLTARLKILGMLDIAERRIPQAGSFDVRIGDRVVRFLISTLPAIDGEEVVLHVSPGPRAIEIDPPPLADVLERPGGLVLVAGPGESGRSATLAALVAGDAAARGRLVAIGHEPDLRRLPGAAVRVPLRPELGLFGAAILRTIHRQAPTAIAYDAALDHEVAVELATHAAGGLRVHAVVGAERPRTALQRLLDLGLEPWLVDEAVRAVVGVRLVRTLCLACRRPTGRAEAPFAAGGCAGCLATGYAGRRAVHEVHLPGRSEGEDLRAAAMALAAAGLTTREEAVRATL